MSDLRISAFIQMKRTEQPTGVGKHINNMTLGLHASPGVALEVIAARNDLDPAGKPKPLSEIQGVPCRPLPFRRVLLERAWRHLNFPKIERWVDNADWIYSPGEAYVATRRIPLATTLHCLMWFERDQPWGQGPAARKSRNLMKSIIFPMFRHARVLISVSEFLKTTTTRLFGVDPKRIHVVPNGVEEEYFAAGDQPPPPPEGRPYVLAVGGLTANKGAEHVLGLARAMKAAKSEAEVWVVGHSHDEFLRQAEQLDNIKNLGYVFNDRLPQIMRGALVLVLASRYETFGIPMLEAMATRTPVITATNTALPETAGGAAMFLDESRPEATADLVAALLKDPAMRQHYAEAGRRRADGFHWSHSVSRLLTVLKENG